MTIPAYETIMSYRETVVAYAETAASSAASYLSDAHTYALDTKVGQIVKEGVLVVEQKIKDYAVAEFALGGAAIYLGIKGVYTGSVDARKLWLKGEKVNAIAFGGLAVLSAALAGYGLCYTVRNPITFRAQPDASISDPAPPVAFTGSAAPVDSVASKAIVVAPKNP